MLPRTPPVYGQILTRIQPRTVPSSLSTQGILVMSMVGQEPFAHHAPGCGDAVIPCNDQVMSLFSILPHYLCYREQTSTVEPRSAGSNNDQPPHGPGPQANSVNVSGLQQFPNPHGMSSNRSPFHLFFANTTQVQIGQPNILGIPISTPMPPRVICKDHLPKPHFC